ncbi:alpha/beta hydrolase domain-containing protein [Noviherbaspirillum pedocola]|uniref:Peptidase n=1 Tax=Noviherbaspirillum pedocola TaxID=2801341 RepID=A0A934SRV9_9BURK|nr:alpha/beta hydrolase domain-containing protein [Noviherbaspirillum pedocola]MBK4735616.1 peptidase [Noviherbaspirillum pedocola]
MRGIATASALCVAALLAACGGGDDNNTAASNTTPTTPAQPAAKAGGVIDRFEIVSTADAYNGATPPGAAGPYQVITGIVHGKLLPSDADNAGIVDLANAPTDADGYVNYTTDVVILRPKSAANARRVLFYDVVNRGNKLGAGSYVGGGSVLTTGAAPASTFPSLLQKGYTIVWSGWQGGIAQTGNGAGAAVGVSFPVAKNKDGTSITGLSREEFVPDFAGGSPTTIPLTYVPASLTDRSEITFTARQSWLNASGQEDYASPSTPVTTWNYVSNADGTVSVSFTPPTTVPGPNGTQVAPDAGTIYTFTYRAKDPTVNGIGFAAVRDLVSFLRNSDKDAQGNANPLNDMKNAPCVLGTGCAATQNSNFDVAIGEGISQSGRFLRDFLYQGFNKDAKGKPVFEGLMPVIPAGRRTWTNLRFSQIGRWSKEHEDHFMPGDQFPFAYNVITDPLTGVNDGLLKKCLATSTCPKIMQIDGSYEWWGGRASLVVTDGAGNDLTLPDNVRYYMVAGTQHGGGNGVTTGLYTISGVCQLPGSPVAETPVTRALIPAMERWLVSNTAPPASQYPTVASGTLVTPTAIGLPDFTNVVIPLGANATPTPLSFTYTGVTNQVFVTDYTNAAPVVNLTKQYRVLVPKVDANGNETTGVLVPDVKVPLATYTGFNIRAAGHSIGEGCTSNGGAIPFAMNAAAKGSGSDSRQTLADLYTGRADYQNKVTNAANTLVSQGYLLPLDATNVFSANAANVSPQLITNP